MYSSGKSARVARRQLRTARTRKLAPTIVSSQMAGTRFTPSLVGIATPGLEQQTKRARSPAPSSGRAQNGLYGQAPALIGAEGPFLWYVLFCDVACTQ